MRADSFNYKALCLWLLGTSSGVKMDYKLTETLIVLDITKTEFKIVLIYIERKKMETIYLPLHWGGSNTKHTNLTWLPVTLSVLDMIIV